MGDTWIDATQSYENETTSTTITNVDNDDLLTPPETSDANYLIKLVNDAPTNTNNLYILQASTNGEIRFLTKEAYLNNDVSANDGNLYYNTKIGKDGKLYLYWTYNFLSNPLRFSGWYDINDEIAGHGNQLTLLEAGAIALEAQVAIANVNITGLNTTLNATITSQNAINASVNTLLNQHTTEIGALATQTAVLPTLQQYFNGSAFVAGSRKGIAGLWRRTNWTSAQTTIAQRYTSRVVQGRQGSVLTAERTLTAPALNSFELLSNTASVATNKAIGDISTAFGIVGAGAILAGIYRYYTNANEEQRNDLIKDLIETKEDMILQQAQTANPYYTTKNRISKAGLVIDETTNNAYGGAVGVYEVEGLTQYAGVILNMEIYLDTGVKKARIINVVAGGSRTWVVGDQIQIPKSTKLGGYVAGAGTIDLLKINVSVIYNPLEAVDITINDLLTEQGEEDRRNRRRKGVIGVNEISDTNAFALTTETETNTITGESITYNTLKSRINLLPTGTNDVDIYTSTGKVGIGTIASSTLHLYNATAPSIRLETATAGASSIVFQRGATNDVSNDFRIINESDQLKFQFQNNLFNFGTTSDIMRLDDKRTEFVKDGYFSAYVGIGMLPDVDRLSITGGTYMNGSLGINTATGSYAFDMLGDARIDGNMGIGAGAPAGVRLYVSGTTQLGGNVGIGISPTIGSALNVNGDINIAFGTNYKIGGLLLSYNNLNNKLSAGTGISISTATTPVISATYTSTNLIGIFNSTQFENVSSVIQVKTGGISYNNLANKLVAGTNITIDPATNIISSTGGSSSVWITTGTTNTYTTGNVAIGQVFNTTIPLDILKANGAFGSIDMMTMKFDADNRFTIAQNWVSAGVLQYEFIQRSGGVNANPIVFRNGRVGIGGTSPITTTTILDVLGNTQIIGNVGIGKAPNATSTTKLDILGDSVVSGKTTTGSINILGLTQLTPPVVAPSAVATMSVSPTPAFTFTPANTLFKCSILTWTGTGTGTEYTIVVPSGGLLCDVLMVGGGGSGGRDIGAGGGGGAVLYATGVLIPQGIYTLFVGRGAIDGSGEARGQTTTGFGATLLGGGTAGSAVWNGATYANDGGSGSGGKSLPDEWSRRGGRPVVGGSRKGGLLINATLSEGSVGGYGVQQSIQVASSGGGGAGAVGGNGATSGGSTGTATGVGGAGVSNTILDTNYFWGGGGGGGSYLYTTAANGGAGGGGAGQNNNGSGITSTGSNGASSFFAVGTITNGINGTGGGGGGTGYTTQTAGSGGAGVIIIRYRQPINHNQTIDFLTTGTNGVLEVKKGMVGGEYTIQTTQGSIVRDRFKVDNSGGTSLADNNLIVKGGTSDTFINNNVGINIDPSSTYRLNVNGDININGNIWQNGFSCNAGFQGYRTFNFTYSGNTNFLLTTRARYCNIICWCSTGTGYIVSNGANMAVNEFRGSLGFNSILNGSNNYFFYWTMQGDTPRPFKAWFGNGSNTTFTFIEMWYN